MLAEGDTTHIVIDRQMNDHAAAGKILETASASDEETADLESLRSGNSLESSSYQRQRSDSRRSAGGRSRPQRPVLLDPDARAAVDQARAVSTTLVANNQVSYAITTGVGKLSDVRIAGDQIRELQVNLVRSHAVGVGEPLPDRRDARHDVAARQFPCQRILRRARRRSSTHSARCSTAVSLRWFRRRAASARAAIWLRWRILHWRSSAKANASTIKADAHAELRICAEARTIKPVVLEAKEAVSLINGTQGMLAVGILALAGSRNPGRFRRCYWRHALRRAARDGCRIRRAHS